MAQRKAVRREEKDALGRGEMPETLRKWKPYKTKVCVGVRVWVCVCVCVRGGGR